MASRKCSWLCYVRNWHELTRMNSFGERCRSIRFGSSSVASVSVPTVLPSVWISRDFRHKTSHENFPGITIFNLPLYWSFVKCLKSKKRRVTFYVKSNGNRCWTSPTWAEVQFRSSWSPTRRSRVGLQLDRNWTSLELHEVIHHRLQSSPSRPNWSPARRSRGVLALPTSQICTKSVKSNTYYRWT